jgi:hypothetical protein
MPSDAFGCCPSTAVYDTTDKLVDYFRIPSLSYVVHVHHDARRVSVHARQGESFALKSFGVGEMVPLPLIDVGLSVDEIYFDPLQQ